MTVWSGWEKYTDTNPGENVLGRSSNAGDLEVRSGILFTSLRMGRKGVMGGREEKLKKRKREQAQLSPSC